MSGKVHVVLSSVLRSLLLSIKSSPPSIQFVIRRILSPLLYRLILVDTLTYAASYRLYKRVFSV